MPKYLYSHTQTSLESLRKAMSDERLGKYLNFADNNLEKALELHSWNCELAASLHTPVQYLELILRNACHTELQNIFGEDWFNNLPTGPNPNLSPRQNPPATDTDVWDYLHSEIKVVKGRLKNQQRNPDNPPCVVAGLSFGFWVAIFTKKLDDQFYRAGLYKILKSQRRTRKLRGKFHEKLERLKGLRNRIAHYEPLLHYDLVKAHALIITTATYIDEDSADWIKHHSKFTEVWSNPPTLSNTQMQVLKDQQQKDRYFDI